ncbi:zinc-binding dehydrogenase [Bdellovibrionota bacterium FG-2]
MKAWRIERHGGPEVLKRVDVDDPVAGPMEIRVRVQAVGLNHLDVWARKGVPGFKFPLPLIPGCDICGVIDSFGPGSEKTLAKEGFKQGSDVILNPVVSCDRCEACLGGFHPLCKNFGILGETQDGGCADFVIAPLSQVIARPAGLALAEAASLPIPYVTAWSMVTRKAQIKPGQWVLVQAGGSGVSVALIQMIKLLGANVITTVGDDSKIQKARDLGADFVIQYKSQSFKDELKKILVQIGRKGCDVAFDHVGASTFPDSMRALSWGGKFVTCGATSGAEVNLDLKALFFKNLSVLGSTMGSKADLMQVLELVKQKKLHAVVDTVLPMEKLPEALARLEDRRVFGKIVVTSS